MSFVRLSVVGWSILMEYFAPSEEVKSTLTLVELVLTSILCNIPLLFDRLTG